MDVQSVIVLLVLVAVEMELNGYVDVVSVAVLEVNFPNSIKFIDHIVFCLIFSSKSMWCLWSILFSLLSRCITIHSM